MRGIQNSTDFKIVIPITKHINVNTEISNKYILYFLESSDSCGAYLRVTLEVGDNSRKYSIYNIYKRYIYNILKNQLQNSVKRYNLLNMFVRAYNFIIMLNIYKNKTKTLKVLK